MEEVGKRSKGGRRRETGGEEQGGAGWSGKE
jgi:hypothetical protein